MTGGREHVQTRATTAGVGSVVDGLHQVFIHAHGNRVGILLIVTEERRVVADVCFHHLESLPIGGTGLEHFVHRVALVFEDVFLQRSEAVGDGTETRTLDIGGVVTCTAAVVVAAFLYAVVDVERKERGRSIEREHAFDVVVHRKLQVHEVLHLLVPSLVEFFERGERAWVAGLKAEFLARFRVDAVVQRNLQYLRRI